LKTELTNYRNSWQTNPMVQGPSWPVDSYSAGQVILCCMEPWRLSPY